MERRNEASKKYYCWLPKIPTLLNHPYKYLPALSARFGIFDF